MHSRCESRLIAVSHCRPALRCSSHEDDGSAIPPFSLCLSFAPVVDWNLFCDDPELLAARVCEEDVALEPAAVVAVDVREAEHCAAATMKRHRDDNNDDDRTDAAVKARAFVKNDSVETADKSASDVDEQRSAGVRVSLQCLTDAPALVREVKKLNLGVLPVQCPEFCYKRAVRDDKRMSWAATLVHARSATATASSSADDDNTSSSSSDSVSSPEVVGALVAEYEVLNRAVHVRTLAVASRYRRQGIARQLIEQLVRQATSTSEPIESVQLHVHVGNADGIAFYTQMGFREHARLENYYRHLEPRVCLVMRYALPTGNNSSSRRADTEATD